jgi:peptide deformylase
MKLVSTKDPILFKELQDVDIKNPQIDLKQTKEDMVELMVSKRGLGLSASQVGIDYKVFVIGEDKENTMMFVNPKVLSVSEETELDFEGCLTYPDVFLKMHRPTSVEASWYDEDGNPQTGNFEGYTARCFLHEFDHLHGVVFYQKVSRLKWDRALKKKQKITKQRNQLTAYMANAQAAIDNAKAEQEQAATQE